MEASTDENGICEFCRGIVCWASAEWKLIALQFVNVCCIACSWTEEEVGANTNKTLLNVFRKCAKTNTT